jgi:hypothetical protein
MRGSWGDHDHLKELNVWEWAVTALGWLKGALSPKSGGGTSQIGFNNRNYSATAGDGGVAVNAENVTLTIGHHHELKEPVLSDDAERLLCLGSTDPQGKIYYSENNHFKHLHTAGTDLLKSLNPRECARWQAALKELEGKYISDKWHHGNVFVLTDAGFKRAKELLQRDPFLGLGPNALHFLAEAAKDDGRIILVQNDIGRNRSHVDLASESVGGYPCSWHGCSSVCL